MGHGARVVSAGIVLTIAALFALSQGRCSKGPTTPDPPPPPTMVSIKATVNADYTVIGGVGGTPVTNGKVRYEGNGLDKTVNLGELVDLGQAEQGKTKNFKITITGDNVLTAVFNNVPLQGTSTLNTDVLNTTTFDLYTWHHWLLLDQSINWRWDAKGVVQLSFNPDTEVPGATGPRLQEADIIQTEDTINSIASRSNGIMTGVNSNRNGSYLPGATPSDGECRTFYCSQSNIGVANATLPIGGDRVLACFILINPDHSGPEEVPGEVLDAFWQGNQNYSPPDDTMWKSVEVSFKRPAGNDQNYRIYSDHEERTGWPNNGTSNITQLAGDFISISQQGKLTDSYPRPPVQPARNTALPRAKGRIRN
jgi:hypothetical protein